MDLTKEHFENIYLKNDIYKTLKITLGNGCITDFERCLNCLGENTRQKYLGMKDILENYVRLLIVEGNYQKAVDILLNCERAYEPVFLQLWDEAHYLWLQSLTGRPLTPIQRYRTRHRFPPPENICPSGERPQTKVDIGARGILKDWFHKNLNNPYPSQESKKALADQTGLSVKQISMWFVNYRRRLKARQDSNILGKSKNNLKTDVKKTPEDGTKLCGTSIGTADELAKTTNSVHTVTEEILQKNVDATCTLNGTVELCKDGIDPSRADNAVASKGSSTTAIDSVDIDNDNNEVLVLHNEEAVMISQDDERQSACCKATNTQEWNPNRIGLYCNKERNDSCRSHFSLCKNIVTLPTDYDKIKSITGDKKAPNKPDVDSKKHTNKNYRRGSVKNAMKYTKLASLLFDTNKSNKKTDHLNICNNRFNQFESNKKFNSKTKSLLWIKLKKTNEREDWKNEFNIALQYKPLTRESISVKDCINQLKSLCKKVDRETTSPKDAAIGMVVEDDIDYYIPDESDVTSSTTDGDWESGFHGDLEAGSQSDRDDKTRAQDKHGSTLTGSVGHGAPTVEDLSTSDIPVVSIGCVEVEVETRSGEEHGYQVVSPLEYIVPSLFAEHYKASLSCYDNDWTKSVQALNLLSTPGPDDQSSQRDHTNSERDHTYSERDHTNFISVPINDLGQSVPGTGFPIQTTSNYPNEDLHQNRPMEWSNSIPGDSLSIQYDIETTVIQPIQQATSLQRLDTQVLYGSDSMADNMDYTQYQPANHKPILDSNCMDTKTSTGFSTVVGEAIEGLLNLSSSQ